MSMDARSHGACRHKSLRAVPPKGAVVSTDSAPLTSGGVRPIQHEQITWCTAAHKPDADTTVMLSLDGCSEPTSVGYWDGQDWIDCTGMPVTEFVVSWAHMPAGFFPQRRRRT